MNELYKCTNYTADINYIISQYIREYDIEKANINILYKYGVIDIDTYNRLYIRERMERQIYIGNMIRDNPKINEVLEKGLLEARKMFLESNNIDESEVLSIKKDAIYIINKIPKYTEFGNIKFRNKNTYTSFYKLDKHIELYYYLDAINGEEILDVKGISDDLLYLHESYFLEFLKVCFESAQVEEPRDTLDIIINFYNQYINLELDTGYYREFNSYSKFRYKDNMSMVFNYVSDDVLDINKPYLNIACNLNYIRNLYQYFGILTVRQIK